MTAATDNPWALLDELIGISGVTYLAEKPGTQSAFYGRCSTEDNQDPKTSRAWQRENAEKFHRRCRRDDRRRVLRHRTVPFRHVGPAAGGIAAARGVEGPRADLERRGCR